MLKKLMLLPVVMIVIGFVVLHMARAQGVIPLPGRGNELISNAGFELDADSNKIPDGWMASNTQIASSDKLKCDKPDKPVAHSGSCAFMFRDNPDASVSHLSQNIVDFSAFADGATLQFSAFIDPHSTTPGVTVGKAQVKLADDSKFKLKLVIPAGVSDYAQVIDSEVLNLTGVSVSKVKVIFSGNQKSGKFLMDDVSLVVLDGVATSTPSNTPGGPTETPTDTPTSTQTPVPTLPSTKLTASDNANMDKFGSSVAVSGDTVLIGAPIKNNGQGAAYVFVRSGDTWTEQQKLTASDPVNGDAFGNAVAIYGDTAVIGAYYKNNSRGAVYIFTRTADVWSQQKILTASDAAAGDEFGKSVAISGDTIVIGAREKNNQQGAAYVFTGSGSNWTEQQKLTASDAANYDDFGWSVAISGDTVVVGATYAVLNKGAAYVFVRNSGIWSQEQKLTMADPENGNCFGTSVAFYGDTALIGNPCYSGNFGAAYVFIRSGNTWSQQQKLLAANQVASENFGTSVAVYGDTAVVGIPLRYGYQGAVDVFTGGGSSWTKQYELTASVAGYYPYLGNAVALDLTTVIAGVPGDGIVTYNDVRGSARVFTLP